MSINFSYGQFWPGVTVGYGNHEVWVDPCYIPANCAISQRCSNADLPAQKCYIRTLKQSLRKKKAFYNRIWTNETMILSN
jgi:hypothetical protein